jgi:DNA-binding beta-propeller fold protein YncE/thiol-disulfide isomerase/thioredoxin
MQAAINRFPRRYLGRWALMVVVALGGAVGWGLLGCGAETDSAQPSSSGTKPAKSSKLARAEEAPLHNPFQHRIKAPPLTGGTGWLNTSGPLDLEKLRGKFVLIDFWTYCCINCMHILPELKELEKTFPNELVVIGVHSAKFDTEQDSKNITDAILRYEIRHPVVNDSNHAIWNRFGVNTWPTLLLIDPEGYVVYGLTGEFKADTIARKLRPGIAWYRKKGELNETPLHFDLAADSAPDTPLRFPGKILADEAGGRLFIADSNHNRIVVARMDGTLLTTIGSGEIGKADGDYRRASFNHPQGMALLGDTLYVADTENHMLRRVDLAKQQVVTVAGTGKQGSGFPGAEDRRGLHGKGHSHWAGNPPVTALNSPWDLCIHGKFLYIAMAGPHQIWKMPLDESEIEPYAGNGREDIVDGRLLPPVPYEEGFASFAQPSGLATDGTDLFVADSEGSSIRSVPFVPSGKVTTIIGTSHLDMGRLFAFGDVDGQGLTPRLQHCLGLAYYKGKLYVADTYNNKIKVIDPEKTSSQTFAGDGQPGDSDEPAEFDEPAGLSAAAGKLYVADTNNQRIRVIDLENDNRVSTLEIKGLEPPGGK